MVGRVELGLHDVAGPEVHDAVGAGAHGLQVRRRLPGLGALEILEHVLGQDHAAVAAEGVGPEGLGPVERDLDGVAIDLVDPRDLAIRAHGHGGGARVGHELPREDHVVGAERLAVVPAHVLLQAPGDGRAVLGETPVGHRRKLGREHRHQVALGIVGDERLVEDPGRVHVFRAGGEVRVEQGRRLPPQRAQGPAPASLARREHRLLGLCVDNAHGPQDLGGHGRRQPEPDQDLREPPPAQMPDLDLSPQVAKRLLIHGAPPV